MVEKRGGMVEKGGWFRKGGGLRKGAGIVEKKEPFSV